MNIWEILEIEETDDRELIKKAYLNKKKTISNEEILKELEIAVNNKLNINNNDIKFTDLALTREYSKLLLREYWEEYYIKYSKAMGFVKDNLHSSLEKNIFNLREAIPKEDLLYIVEKFKLYGKNAENIFKIKSLPDFNVYFIRGKNDLDNIRFYKIRYEIYIKLKEKSNNLKEIKELFYKAERINSEDKDLQFLKLSYGLLEDIAYSKADPLVLDKTTRFFKNIDDKTDTFYLYYRALIDILENEQYDELDYSFYEYENSNYMPKYLSLFINGYIKYQLNDFIATYNYWSKIKTVEEDDYFLNTIIKNLFINKFEILNDEIKGNLIARSYLNFSDIIHNYELSTNIENWKIILENISEKNTKDIIKYIEKNYVSLPKEVLEYAYIKTRMDKLENNIISKEIKDNIKNMPRFNFNNFNIPADMKYEFYKDRYEFYEITTKIYNNDLADNLYMKLNRISFDIDVELIRLQQIFYQDIYETNDISTKFYNTEKKLEEIQQYKKSNEITIYNIFIKIYKYRELTERDYDRFVQINKNDLILQEDIYNFISLIIYKLANNEEKFNEIRKNLPYDYYKEAEDILVYLGKIKRDNITRRKKVKRKTNYTLLIIPIIVIIIFVILIKALF